MGRGTEFPNVPMTQRETVSDGSTSEDLGDSLQKDEPSKNIWWV